MDTKHTSSEVRNPEGSAYIKLDTPSAGIYNQKEVATTAPTVSMVETRKMTPMERTHCVSKIQSIISTLCLLYSCYGFDPKGYSAGKTVRWWLGLCEDIGGRNAWLKVAKYKIASFFSHHMGQPLPKSPFSDKLGDHPGILLGGRAYRWMQKLSRKASEDDMWSFLTSILYSKKGFPRPDKDDCKAAAQECVKKLATAKVTPSWVSLGRKWADVNDNNHLDVALTKEKAKGELRRTVEELFKGKRYTMDDRTSMFFPSTRANFRESRDELGTVGTLLKHPEVLKGLRSAGQFLVKFSEQEIQRSDIGREEAQSEDHGEKFTADIRVLKARFRALYWRVLKRAQEERPFAVPVGLPEPLKIRVITKGPPMTYAALRPLQKFMWETLRSHRCLRLIGEPVSEEILRKTLGLLKPGEVFLSGDYSDATNELCSWVSQHIANSISDVIGLSDTETDLFVKALTQHVLLDEEGRAYPQATGQLMGSIVSFPVLCIANVAMTRYAMEQALGKRIPLKTIRALFNGDDILAVTSREGYGLWRKCLGFIGLQESVGKTYVSSDYLNVNSTSYRYEIGVRVKPKAYDEMRDKFLPAVSLGARQEPFIENSNPYRQIPYVNLGLMKGLKRAGREQGKVESIIREDSALGPRAREMLRLGPKKMRDLLMTHFVRFNMEKLKAAKGLPYFISEKYGGLGLPAYISTDGEMQGPAIWELRCAAEIQRNHSDKIRVGDEAAWKIHKHVMRLLPRKPTQVLTEEQDKEYRRLYGALCVSVLFDEGLNESDLFCSESAAEKSRYMHNKYIWRKIQPLPKGEGFSAESLCEPSKHVPQGIAVHVVDH